MIKVKYKNIIINSNKQIKKHEFETVDKLAGSLNDIYRNGINIFWVFWNDSWVQSGSNLSKFPFLDLESENL